MSWFKRTPKPPKHEHSWKIINAQPYENFFISHKTGARTKTGDLVRYIRQCRTCSVKEMKDADGMAMGQFTILYGPVEPAN